MSVPNYVIELMPFDALIAHAKALQYERRELERKLAKEQALYNDLFGVTRSDGSKELTKLIAQAKAEQKEEDAKICDNIRSAHFTNRIPDAYLAATDCAAAIRNAPSLP